MKIVRPLAFALPVLTALAGCIHQSAREPVRLPQLSTHRCRVDSSRADRLVVEVVEWESPERATLEATARNGLVAVQYAGCEMTVLGSCKVEGTYQFSGTEVKTDQIHIGDSDELHKNLPFSAVRLESTLRAAKQLDLSMSVIGHYAAPPVVIHEDKLVGSCSGATHIVNGIVVGAFAFSANAWQKGEDNGAVLGATEVAKSEAERGLRMRDGDETICKEASKGAGEPLPGCGALIKVDLVAIPEAAARAASAAEAAEQEAERQRSALALRRGAGWASAGTGVGALVVGGVLGLIANSQVKSIEHGGLSSSADIEAANRSAHSLATAAWVAAGVGLVGLAAGTTLLLTTKPPSSAGPAMEANAQGVGVAW